jgi:hypothetical protein
MPKHRFGYFLNDSSDPPSIVRRARFRVFGRNIPGLGFVGFKTSQFLKVQLEFVEGFSEEVVLVDDG